MCHVHEGGFVGPDTVVVPPDLIVLISMRAGSMPLVSPESGIMRVTI